MNGRPDRDPGEGDVILTPRGRTLLAERARRLREEDIPALVLALQDPERGGQVEAEYDRAVSELGRLSRFLEASTCSEVRGSNPTVVEPGDVVNVRFEDGSEERYMIVHPVEAHLDSIRISMESPLSRALLGHGPGDEVDVRAPSHSYRCMIVAIEVGEQTTPRTRGTRPLRHRWRPTGAGRAT